MTLTSRLVLAAILATGTTSPLIAESRPPGGSAMLLEIFSAADTDADGALTEAELATHRAAEFAAADSNSDGILGANEIAAHQLARIAPKIENRAAQMIKARDSNGDGGLSATEMAEGPVQRDFARIDADDNGAISKHEAETAAAQRKHHRKGTWGGMN